MIPALNSAETIRFTLSSVLSNDFPRNEYEVIVVDNGSVDNTINVVRRFPVKVYSCLKKGQGAALNLGIKKAMGDTICITNSDVIVPHDWLRKISNFFKNHPDVDGVGGPVLSPLYDHKNDIQKFTGELYVEDQHFPTVVMESQYMRMYDGGLLGSANCAYRKDTLVSIGGFDESLLFTEVDLCWRLIKGGKHLIFDPNIKVVHIGFPWTLLGVFRQQFKWGKASAQLMKVYQSSSPLESYVKREIVGLYKIMRSLFSLLSPRCRPRTKQILRCFHYISYHLGRLYGQGSAPIKG